MALWRSISNCSFFPLIAWILLLKRVFSFCCSFICCSNSSICCSRPTICTFNCSFTVCDRSIAPATLIRPSLTAFTLISISSCSFSKSWICFWYSATSLSFWIFWSITASYSLRISSVSTSNLFNCCFFSFRSLNSLSFDSRYILSLIRSVLICSFSTWICPSFCCFVIFISEISAAIVSISCFKLSKSSSCFPYFSFALASACSVCFMSRCAISIFWSSSFNSCSRFRFSNKNNFTSSSFNWSLKSRYSLARSDCFWRGETWRSNSVKISVTLTRFSRSISNDLCVSSLFFLYFTIPAASSKSSLRSSGFPLKICSICPCPMIE